MVRAVHTRAAVLTADAAIHRVFERETSHGPMAIAEHRLGEYGALGATGVFALGDAVP